ncbi:hypothetical protein BMF89_19525 [Arthrobacter sp. SRS-W-1-2016]|uniref:MFS transporter n=1 Tax=Arthrobacter TaxID=1663 RepID=UPI000990C5F8|nr:MULTISPECIES: MFS transporter [Arthrobacter]MDQ0212714.1 EmrB/QacA subfamily drug resistance transporter [Arthrobacter bambusae]MDQ0237153.1 EmrB/QacA subfamily drug resistance transporter [Arthrobacter bambusae]OOP59867.1 hypothetical protein BMF89_19525 [Arthrobacter sp. SRS-W-1-2016]
MTDTSRTKPQRWLVLCACLAQVTVVLDTTIIAVALPDAQASLGFDDSDRQWTITAYTLTFGSLLLLGGRLSSILGARAAFLLGLAGFGVASLIGGLADSLALIVTARAAQGLFAAILAPTNLSLMNTAFPGTEGRARAFAVFGSVAGAGAALGLILGGALTDMLGWRWCFFVNVPIIALTAGLAIRGLRGTSSPRRTALLEDSLGLVLGTAAMFAIVFGFSRAEALGWGHPVTLALFVSGSALAASFIIRERLAPSPIMPLTILFDARRATSYVSIALVGLAQMGSSLYLTYYLQNSLGYDPFRSGIAFLPVVGGLVVAAVLSTRVIVPRFGLLAAFVIGPAVQAIGFLWMSQLSVEDAYVETLLGPMLVVGLGLGTIMAPAMSSATHGIGAERSGLASAVANASQQFGASLGVAFLSSLAAHDAAERLRQNAQVVAQRTMDQLTSMGLPPTSPKGIEIRDAIVSDAVREATVGAYGTGFIALAIVCASVAIIVTVIFVISGLTVWRARIDPAKDYDATARTDAIVTK